MELSVAEAARAARMVRAAVMISARAAGEGCCGSPCVWLVFTTDVLLPCDYQAAAVAAKAVTEAAELRQVVVVKAWLLQGVRVCSVVVTPVRMVGILVAAGAAAAAAAAAVVVVIVGGGGGGGGGGGPTSRGDLKPCERKSRMNMRTR